MEFELSYETSRWLLAGHIISIISWMAGLLYLPRLFVYHTQCDPGSQQSETFKVMERRLQNAIMNPSMVASFAFGIPLVMDMPETVWEEGWIYVKIISIVGLVISHFMMWSWRRNFKYDRNIKSEVFYRAMNEVPTFFMILIVIFVFVKPF